MDLGTFDAMQGLMISLDLEIIVESRAEKKSFDTNYLDVKKRVDKAVMQSSLKSINKSLLLPLVQFHFFPTETSAQFRYISLVRDESHCHRMMQFAHSMSSGNFAVKVLGPDPLELGISISYCPLVN